MSIEANPLVSSAVSLAGVGTGLAATKMFAVALGIVLHLRRIHVVVALLTLFYVAVAILPWTFMFFTLQYICVILDAVRPDPLAYLATELDSLKSHGLYRHLRILEGEQQAGTTFDHTSVVNLSSNNYLGLTTHPRLRAAAIDAIERFGVGSGSVRTIAGTMAIHVELEERLARFKKTESAVVFQSGFTANAGTVSSILTKDDVVISDELNHARIIDGCCLSRATVKVFPHTDVDAARKLLQALPASQRTLLISDGVFSMEGDLGPLPDLCSLAEQFVCIMMVDDARASGVFGANGRGTVDHFGVHGRVDIQVGTLSKAIGALGGYVAGSRAFIEFLHHRARPFLLSTSHPPSVAATCIAALDAFGTVGRELGIIH